jgi:hypothetical protein
MEFFFILISYFFTLISYSLRRSEVSSRVEGVPIKDTMLSEMCPDVEAAFCFPQKYRFVNSINIILKNRPFYNCKKVLLDLKNSLAFLKQSDWTIVCDLTSG